MAEYNRIQIGNIHLTDDGLITGMPCRVDVEGLDGLVIPYAGNTVKAADGTPHTFLMEFGGEGVDIRILPLVVLKDSVYASLKTLFTTALGAGSTINTIIEGDTGDFDLECYPLFSANGGIRPIRFSGKFDDGRIYGVVINLTVASIN